MKTPSEGENSNQINGTTIQTIIQEPNPPHVMESIDTTFPYKTYREYIRAISLKSPEYNRLNKFFLETGAIPSRTRVLIADSINGDHLRMESFGATVPTSQVSVLPEYVRLSTALTRRPADVETRIVHLIYNRYRDVDRDMIGEIALHFQISPRVLWTIIDLNQNRHDAGNLELPQCLPSEQLLWVLSISPDIAVVFREKTVIIFARDEIECNWAYSAFDSSNLTLSVTPSLSRDIPRSLRNTNSARYEIALKKMSPTQITSADANPVQYIYPLARLLIWQSSRKVESLSRSLYDEIFSPLVRYRVTLPKFIEAVNKLTIGLVSCHLETASFSDYLSELVKLDSKQSNQYESLLRDTEKLEHMIEVVQGDMKMFIESIYAQLSMMNTRVVTRLTVIAFFFIPLSFVCSFFGMSFVEFGTGRLNLWVFFAVAIPVCVITMSRIPQPSLGLDTPIPAWKEEHIIDSDSESVAVSRSGLYSDDDSESRSGFRVRCRDLFKSANRFRRAALSNPNRRSGNESRSSTYSS